MAEVQTTAQATVTLDARALEALLAGGSLDRIAELVAARLQASSSADGLLTAAEAAEVAGVHPETLRRAIRNREMTVVGYVGRRPRLRREDVEAWVASALVPVAAGQGTPRPSRRRRVARGSRVLGDALARANGAGAS